MKNISIKDIKDFSVKYNKDKNNKVIENAITNNGINEVALNRDILNENKMFFNIELPESKRMDQKKSGRCWCFAGLNMLKHNIANNMNVKVEDFNLSANYLTFYDKFEKMNTIYEEVIALKKDDFDTLNDLKITEYSEGGYWEFFKELVKKYGIIPVEYMKENKVTETSQIANEVIDAKIKRDIYTILEAKKEKKDLDRLTKKLMSENYTLLSKILGEPPQTIKLEYKDKDNNIIMKDLTPQEFMKEYLTINLDDYVTVGSIDMYNKEYYKKYIRKYGESIFDISKSEFINLPKKELKELVIKQLKDNEPVWFASEVTKMCSRVNGILDTRIYDYEELFNFKPLTISEGLNLHYYECCHAMSMVGVHIVKNKPIRWKVENSWGDANNKGYFIMNDNYFDKFVMEGIINKKYLSQDQLAILKQTPIEMRVDDPV